MKTISIKTKATFMFNATGLMAIDQIEREIFDLAEYPSDNYAQILYFMKLLKQLRILGNDKAFINKYCNTTKKQLNNATV